MVELTQNGGIDQEKLKEVRGGHSHIMGCPIIWAARFDTLGSLGG